MPNRKRRKPRRIPVEEPPRVIKEPPPPEPKRELISADDIMLGKFVLPIKAFHNDVQIGLIKCDMPNEGLSFSIGKVSYTIDAVMNDLLSLDGMNKVAEEIARVYNKS